MLKATQKLDFSIHQALKSNKTSFLLIKPESSWPQYVKTFKLSIENKYFLSIFKHKKYVGVNNPRFDEFSSDYQPCTIGHIIFYTSRNVKKGYIFVDDNYIQTLI